MRTGKILAVMFVLLSLAIIYLIIHANNMTIKYNIEGLKRKILSIHSINRDLSYKNAELKSLDRIEKIARGKLRMVRPEEIKYIRGTPEGSP